MSWENAIALPLFLAAYYAGVVVLSEYLIRPLVPEGRIKAFLYRPRR